MVEAVQIRWAQSPFDNKCLERLNIALLLLDQTHNSSSWQPWNWPSMGHSGLHQLDMALGEL